MDSTCGTHGREDKCFKVFVGRAERRRQLGRVRYKLEDNIKVDLKQDERSSTDLIWLRTGISDGLL
jgi:hypothetical protein